MHHRSYRQAWAEVSLDAFRKNVLAFKQHIQPDTKLMAVVKADGYGHGAEAMAKEAVAAGADYLAVALLEEAILLREAGMDEPILVLGYTPPNAVETAISQEITLTVFTKEAADAVRIAAESLKKTARVHVKIETGMNRIGITEEKQALQIIESLTSDYVFIEGAFTHFADADNPDPAYTKEQFAAFCGFVDFLENHISIPIKHCCNSAATIAYPEMHLDMVRVGISLYGLYPEEHLKPLIPLKQVMSLKVKPVLIKKLEANQTISYGRTFTTAQTSTIATLPIGYADGLSRSLSNKGDVTVQGKRTPIVGRICMDQTMIDVTGIEFITVSDTVTVFGEPSEGFISMGEIADHMGTIHYETACLIGKRVPRVYMKNGEVTGEKLLKLLAD
ncbi:alanine racemase [Thalassobacillus devorans]|uniref:Alanine racemase n=1 Tax=Thalassobacillus devorans TaxID=279813 RepID=A0ABQ1NR06_9BACI|nr:alanine racemase [Thalassobacillus devorans]NIK27464.1 alanine racemase [Thalassobacillus devorans]GGC77917.1 alanine racemase [Thalassobacillus devorans]